MSANLIRKRRVFDEKLPSGESVNDAVIRLARTGDSIRPVDTPQPPIRISSIPVTDSLPPDRPQGFPSAEAGYQNATQPINRDIATDALKRISIPTEMSNEPSGMQPVVRPIGRITAVNSPAPEPPVSNVTPFAQKILARMNEQPISDPAAHTAPPILPRVELGERPVMTGNSQTDEEQLQNYNPKDHNGRWKSEGLGLLRGFLGGGLPGLVRGGIQSAIDPATDEKYQQAVDLQRLGGINDRRMAQQAEQAKLEDLQAQTDLRRLEPQMKTQEIQARAQERERDNLRSIYTNLKDFNPDKNPQHKRIADRAEALGMTLPAKAEGEKALPQVWDENGQLQNRHPDGTLAPALRDGKPVIDKSRTTIPVKMSDGTTVYVKPGTALTADSTRTNQANSNTWRAGEWEQREAERVAKQQSERDAVLQANQENQGQIADLQTRQKDAEARASAEDATTAEKTAARREATALANQILERRRAIKRVPDVASPRPAPRSATTGRSVSSTSSGNYAGRSIKRSNVAAWGKERGLSEAEALKQLEGLGVKVN
jgi:hypothetical protein